MAKMTAKRQITLPVSHCRELGIEPGDDLDVFVHEGHITILKKSANAAKGILRGVKRDSRYTDQGSRDTTLEAKR